MRRTDFLKGIIATLGLSVLPKAIVKQYHRIYLLQSFIRGFKFYEGINMLDEMNEGNMLQLVREPKNEFDTNAIALHFNNKKIGYLPREDNEMLSKLMDAEVIDLQAEITHLQKEAKAWESVHIAVYVLKETTGALPDTAQHLTALQTPKYRTLKLSDQKVAMVYFDDADEISDEELMDADCFYHTITKHAKSNKGVNILQNNFQSPEYLDSVIEGGKMIVNTNHLPQDLKEDSLINAVSDISLNLDGHFGESGYLVANVNRVAHLADRIEKIVTTSDKTGTLFHEILFV